MSLKSKRRTAVLYTLLVCLGLLLWTQSKCISYFDKNLASAKEVQKKYVSMQVKDQHSETNRLLQRQILEQNHPLLKGTRSQLTPKFENGRNISADLDAFEPEIHEDIQSVESRNPRIPHIMHFIFITGIKGKHGIPSIYKDNVLSFLHFNPNWTFYFWSDESGRELIATRQPALLSIYDNHADVVFKANALRYVLLYEFGGVYTDLDMKCIRPFDRATMKYACILTPEPFEHSAILYQLPYFFSNALILCRPKHPFFKQVIESIPKTAYLKDRLEADGTKFFTKQYSLYNKVQSSKDSRISSYTKSNSPYFYQGESDHNDALYVANTQYFMSSFDFGANSQFTILCKKYSSQFKIVERGCNLWKKRKTNKTTNPFSFTDHNWKHMYSIKSSTKIIPIHTVIPKIKEYNVSFEMLDVKTLI